MMTAQRAGYKGRYILARAQASTRAISADRPNARPRSGTGGSGGQFRRRLPHAITLSPRRNSLRRELRRTTTDV